MPAPTDKKDKKGDGSSSTPDYPPPAAEIAPVIKKPIEAECNKPSATATQLAINPVTVNAHLVKSDVANLEGRKLLQQSIRKLYGVTEAAADVLENQLKITSIFDLAMSHHFNSALRLVDPTTPLEAAFVQHGFIPGDAVRSEPDQLKISALANSDIDELNFSNTKVVGDLKTALQIKTIRDMALWPPYQNARHILLSTFDPMELTRRGSDPEAPTDLIPACGNFPTECVYYTSVFLDKIDPGEALTDLGTSGGVSLFSEGQNIQGFDRPARGGILTYKQSWYAQGVTLGQLLHSLALAPGESTRIAMVDWYRRTGEKISEEIAESEALSQTAQQSRSISEITQAVATEMQYGYNRTSTSSKSARAGFGGFGWSVGGSISSSVATSVSRSFGQRDMSAEMNQRILSSTQQNATAERSRRATIVRECYQEEKETLTTRAVTNYNHMHALTVQYYEVVQVYRVKTELWNAERVLFIPMKPIRFEDERVFRRYREVLKAVAVNDEVKNNLDAMSSSYTDLTLMPGLPSSKTQRLFNSPTLQGIEYSSDVEIEKITIYKLNENPKIIKNELKDLLCQGKLELKLALNDLDKVCVEFKETKMAEEDARRRQPSSISFEILMNTGQKTGGTYTFSPPVDIVETIIDAEKSKTEKVTRATTRSITVMEVKVVSQLADDVAKALIEHLQDTPHYSHAIWLSLDPLTLSQILAGYKYGDKDESLAGQIDPTPVAITGNYLGFRWSGDQDESTWRDDIIKKTKEVEAEIPLPSGGVFAEAVLGRYNSAEKLDITRYWNWQDSPIPFTASDIAALSAGGKSQQSTLTPGQLSQPAVTINALPNLPEPTGMRDIMQALTVSNMFRDMSNQAATAALAGQSLETASKGAGEAAQQASENYRTAIKTIGDVAKTVIPLVATGGLSAGSISKAGATVNLASKLDQKKSASADGNGTGNQESALESMIGVVTKSAEKTDTEKQEEAEEE